MKQKEKPRKSIKQLRSLAIIPLYYRKASKFTRENGLILPRRKTGLTLKEHKYVSKLIRGGRNLGLCSFIRARQKLKDDGKRTKSGKIIKGGSNKVIKGGSNKKIRSDFKSRNKTRVKKYKQSIPPSKDLDKTNLTEKLTSSNLGGASITK